MKVITLVGADASGKDTQIALLKKHLEGQGRKVQVITIWDSLGEFAAIPDKKILVQTVETFLLQFEAEARSFFLLSCLKNSESRIQPDADYVLLNGFFHKYWASEAAYGVSHSLWSNNISLFRKSDTTIYLNTSLEHCLSRKESWSNYEQGKGKFKGRPAGDREAFQKRLHTELQAILKQFDKVVTVDGNRGQEEVFSDLIKLI